MKRALAALVLAGCVKQVMLVDDVKVDGYDLVVEKCRISSSSFTRCTTERVRIPVATTSPTPMRARPTPDREEAYRALAPLRAPFAACAVTAGITGALPLSLVVDAHGQALVETPVDAGFASCAAAVLARATFPASRTLHITVVAP